jgi:hypothetical protein
MFPDENSRGVRPTQEAKRRALRNVLMSAIDPTNAVAPIGPMPGMPQPSANLRFFANGGQLRVDEAQPLLNRTDLLHEPLKNWPHDLGNTETTPIDVIRPSFTFGR